MIQIIRNHIFYVKYTHFPFSFGYTNLKDRRMKLIDNLWPKKDGICMQTNKRATLRLGIDYRTIVTTMAVKDSFFVIEWYDYVFILSWALCWFSTHSLCDSHMYNNTPTTNVYCFRQTFCRNMSNYNEFLELFNDRQVWTLS